MIAIPFIPGEPFQSIEVTLGTVQCIVSSHWNDREKAHYLDVALADGTSIIRSIKVVLAVRLGRTSTHPIFQQGCMFALDGSGTGADPGLDDLGGRVNVLYADASDRAALESP